MRTSDIVQLKRDIISAIEAAGKKEFGWFVLLEKLDELGYDLIQRTPSPGAIVAAVEACAAIAEAVETQLHKPNGLTPEDDRLFRD